jgi:hypothetical protein
MENGLIYISSKIADYEMTHEFDRNQFKKIYGKDSGVYKV